MAIVLRTYLNATLQRAVAHLSDKLQGSMQLLPGAAQRDHGAVGVGIAQPLQAVPLWQRAHPVEQLPRPAQVKNISATGQL